MICKEATWVCGAASQENPGRLSHEFLLENTTARAVPIQGVSPDCGCIVADKPPRQIGPRGVVSLRITANLNDKPGPFQKQVRVTFGTSPVSMLTLRVQGDVAPSSAFYAAPGHLDFGIIRGNETATRTIKVARFDASPVEYVRAEAGSDAVEVSR
ncbi:DUF1573 domain-containing protein, partial [Singulisphaera rosea]